MRITLILLRPLHILYSLPGSRGSSASYISWRTHYRHNQSCVSFEIDSHFIARDNPELQNPDHGHSNHCYHYHLSKRYSLQIPMLDIGFAANLKRHPSE